MAATMLPRRAAAQNIREEVKKAPKPKLTKAPKLLTFVEAIYPKDALAKAISGAVVLSLTIDALGKVKDAKVDSAPLPSLGSSAKNAALKFVFSPAEVDHKPAPVVIRYRYHFRLEQTFKPRIPWWVTGDKPPPKASDVLLGQVRERGNRLPLAGVAVAVMEAGVEVKTDSRGRFAIADLPPGTYRVQAISLQHARETVKVTVEEGTQSRIKFYLRPLSVSRYETVVRGKRRQTAVTRVALRGRQLTTVPGTFGDPVRVVENLPGVARVPFVGGALLIRGATPGDSGTFFDGVRIPILYHFLGGPSVLNAEFIKRVDYYPGNADARYGRLTAGVVDVASQDTFTKAWHGSVDLNLLNVGLMLKAPITDRISVTGAIRRSYVDALLPVVFDAAGVNATTVVPVYYDYQLRVDAKLHGDDRASVLFFGSDDDLRIASSEADSDFAIDLNSRTSFHRILGRWQKSFAKGKAVSRFQPWAGVDVSSVSLGTGVDFQLLTWFVGAREDLDLKLSRRLRLRMGGDVEIAFSGLEAEIPTPKSYRIPGQPAATTGGGGGGAQNQVSSETTHVDVKETLGSTGFYVDAIWNPTPKLSVIPGLRFDLFFYMENNIRPDLVPRLTLRYRWNEAMTFKAAAGLYSRAPGPAESNAIFGNPKLVLEHAAHFALGIERRLFSHISVDAQLYYLHRYDQAIRDRTPFDPQGQSVRQVFYRSEGRGYSTGLELIVKHEVTRHFYGWIAYTLSLSKQQREVGGDLVRFIFDQRHILTVVGSYRFGRGWELGARFRLASGRPDTPLLHGVFDGDASGSYSRVNGEERSVSRQTFHQLDLRLEKRWLFKTWRFSLYLDVQNVYNAENPEATFYDYRFRQSGPLRGLPFLPTLGVKGSF